MADSPSPPTPPQFDRVEYVDNSAAAATAFACTACRQPLRDVYYSVNGSLACPACTQEAQASHLGGSRVLRVLAAAGLGILAGLVGAIGHFLITRISGYDMAIIAIVVGGMVGWGVRRGSRYRGGWFYQVLAVLIAYNSMGCSYTMQLVAEVVQDPETRARLFGERPGAESTDAATSQPDGAASSAPAEHAESAPASTLTAQPTVRDAALAILALLGLALAGMVTLPVAIGIQSPIVLLIVAFGLWQAWRMNRGSGLIIEGPLRVGDATTGDDGANRG